MHDEEEGISWTDSGCPVARTLDLVGDRWSLLIVRDSMDGARSFTDFQRRTGIARNILSDRLRKLTSRGLLAQVEAPSGRRRLYELTEAGRELFPIIVTLRQWGERHAYSTGETHSVLLDGNGNRVPELVPEAEDGSPLTSENTRVDRDTVG